MSELKSTAQNAKLPSNDLRVRSYNFSLQVVWLATKLPTKQVFWTIADQLLRAATSVGANLIEAKASSSRKDFIKFYEIALKSANETRYWLSLLRDSKLLSDPVEVNELLGECDQICRMLASSILILKGKNRY